MKKFSTLLIGLLFSLSATVLYAEGAKVGIVDLQKIMQTSPQMKAIQQQLEKDFKPRRDKLMGIEENLKKDMEKFKRDNTVMSANEKKELEKKIISTRQTLEREGQQYQQELSTAHNEAMEGLYTKIRNAIKKVAETEHYDIILQKDAAPFSMDSLDVTASVMKNIG